MHSPSLARVNIARFRERFRILRVRFQIFLTVRCQCRS